MTQPDLVRSDDVADKSLAVRPAMDNQVKVCSTEPKIDCTYQAAHIFATYSCDSA